MIKKFFSGIGLLLLFVMAVAVAGTASWFFKHLNPELNLESSQVLEVAPGRSFISLLNQFEQEGVIATALPMRIWLRLNSDVAPIRAGEYRLESPLTLRELHRRMQAGEVITYRLTLLEGWTFREFRRALAQAEKLEAVTAEWSEAEIMEAVGMPGEAAEGWFFPDTYTYHKGMRDLDLLRLANRRMRQLLEEVWDTRQAGLPYRNAYDALIMASIIERETGAPHERRDISGVFVRRLHKGMRLQTDPTVIYGMGERYQGRITRSDLREATPWNTYVIRGLPPTPIAMPGEAALRASVDPAEGETLFFVARGDGTHQFSRTLEEHNRAVREFQLNRREGYRSWPAAPDNQGAGGGENE
ncbi:endolytic transglycosylase MltG [Marinospirillum alkaliphilum]|uniref:Endolytic murein transglycosylase n=1 Tax=Marinospirillum alkaliphilum DSM 21637 TaxID=1122209 RepID=A0A1K1UH52_9GAMM|nr:endolytic transglycosylase MltG [Marinospirillum alkaliphilum]SFX12130.1 UPF0755 protein [Marinospirillum alkaliphilum DSM 21637]